MPAVEASRRIAVFGASGFVGVRLMETAVLGGAAKVIAILRQPRGMARLSKLGIIPRWGDLSHPASLSKALEGCSAVVNLTAGDTGRFLQDLQNLAEACRKTGIRTLVHMSSAAVYERVDSPISSEDTLSSGPYSDDYTRAKADTERWIASQVSDSSIRIVCLRPGFIWGPRSPWVTGPATAMREGSAFLFNGGRGICNLCHVDNAVGAIFAAAQATSPTAGFYNIGDAESATWGSYYRALAAELGMDPAGIADLPEASFRESIFTRVYRLKDSPPAKAIKKKLRSQTKLAMQRWLFGLRPAPLDPPPGPRVNRQMWWWQTVRNPLPKGRFSAEFSHQPPVTFTKGMQSTGIWLRESGYSP